MTKQEASKEIARKLAEARKLITECEQIADDAGVDFSWGGPSYGMGGYYNPKPKPEDTTEEDDDNSWCSSDSYGWKSSSESC